MRLRDPFETRCPEASELYDEELRALLTLHEDLDVLTGWEHQFCASIVKQLWYGRSLSVRQLEVLDNGILAKVWRNDPDLWDGELPPASRAIVIPSPSVRARYLTQRKMIERARFLHDTELETILRAGMEQIEELMDAGQSVPPF